MAWSYDPALSTARDQIRNLIGDTDVADPLLQDSEITFYQAQGSGVYRQAALCAQAIAGKFARRPDRAIGKLQISSSQQAQAYRSLAADLRRQASLNDVQPYAGGISIADKDSSDDDTDRVSPLFKKTTGDVPGSNLTDTLNVLEDEP